VNVSTENTIHADNGVTIQSATDKAEAMKMAAAAWGTRRMIFGFQIFDLADIEALEMRDDKGSLIGVAHWSIKGKTAYLCALMVYVPGHGYANQLLAVLMQVARDAGATTVRAMLTNDNTTGMIFYQKNGFRFSNMFVGAVDTFRSKEPDMIKIGQHGLAVHDTLELERDL
jgi:GNAT superfamily N-acetyltransferase